MYGLIVSAVLLNQNISVDKGFVIIRIVANKEAVFTVDQIKISIAAFDPVIADDGSGRAVLQSYAVRSARKGPNLLY